MKTKGLRISDIKEGKCIPLSEILASIPHVNKFNWALLWLDVIPIKEEGSLLAELQKKINGSKNGFPYSFKSLVELSRKSFQEIEVLIIGCSAKGDIHRYNKDQKMYETCDFVIEMIDGSFWEVFSKNMYWIDQLAERYKEIELITPDFQTKKMSF